MTSPPGSSVPTSPVEHPSSSTPSLTNSLQVDSSSTASARKTSIAFAALPEDSLYERRKSSNPSASFSKLPKLSDKQDKVDRPEKPERPRSLSSPPPPSHFSKRVAFDTFDNKDAQDFSLTLRAKHRDYVYSRRSRTFLCGTDQNEYSEFALEWLLDELVDDGDEIICLRVVDKDSKAASSSSSNETREKEYRAEAEKLLNDIIDKNDDDKAISIVLEYAVGKVQDTIQRMIQIYEPVILIVGTKGRSLGGIQGLLPGSVSKYCLQHSPVPVIVVRPSTKREKKKRKRQADPSRKAYMDLLEKSTGTEGMFSLTPRGSTPNVVTPNEDISPGTVTPGREGLLESSKTSMDTSSVDRADNT